MRILAIETSCDETAVCVLEARGNFRNAKIRILSNIVASQVKIHAPWGGVVPNLAKREHQKNLPIIFKKVFKEAKLSPKNPRVDLMAVTSGPGLEPCLWTGINFAEDLAKKWNKPLIGINHLEGHIFSVFLPRPKKILFPALALIVSGGHTELVLMEKPLKYKVIGQTLDDAAGEAFDKVARLLGLGYPGGPAISKEAEKWKSQIPKSKFQINSKFQIPNIKLPRPMINSKDYNFSFSGLKTAVLYKLKDLAVLFHDRKKLPPSIVSAVAAEFQQAVIDVLLRKTIRAAKEHKAKTIILGGGVAANKELRRQMAEAVKLLKNNPILLIPEMEFTGDNAAMIALAAYFRDKKAKKISDGSKITADSNLKLK
jgi:N6-L-threonylcarbamoyladenine synthase